MPLFNPSVTGILAVAQVPYTNLAHTSGPQAVLGTDNLRWDAATARLGVGVGAVTPSARIHAVGDGLAPALGTSRATPLALASGFSGYNDLLINTTGTLQWQGTVPSTYSLVSLASTEVTLAATSPAQIITHAATVYIVGQPSAGTNVTISNPWALRVADGNCALGSDAWVPIVHTQTITVQVPSVDFIISSNASDDFIYIKHANQTLAGMGISIGGQGTLTSGVWCEINDPRAVPTVDGRPFLVTGVNITTAVNTGEHGLMRLAGRQVQWQGTATVALHRHLDIVAPTLTSTVGKIITDATSVYINAAPTAAGSLTITNNWAMIVDAGNSRFDGDIRAAANISVGALTAPSAKLHVFGDGTPGPRPLCIRADTDGAFFGDISLSTYATETVFYEIVPAASTTRSQTLRISGGALTSIAGGELIDFRYTPRNVQFSGTGFALQRAIVFEAPTYSFTAPQTITQAATLYVPKGPIAGTNCTFSSAAIAQGAYGAIIDGGLHVAQQNLLTATPVIVTCRPALQLAASYAFFHEFFLDTASSITWQGAVPSFYYSAYVGQASTTLASTTAAQTITNASTVYIGARPIAGTNVTITNSYGLWCAVDSRLDGTVLMTSALRVNSIQGDTASNPIQIQANGGGSNFIWMNAQAASLESRAISIGAATVTAGVWCEINDPRTISTTIGDGSAFRVTGSSITDAANGSEHAQVRIAGRSIQWVSPNNATIALQRHVNIAAQTLTSTIAKTITNAVTVYINAAPTAAGSITITNAWAFQVAAGAVRLDGSLQVGATSLFKVGSDGKIGMFGATPVAQQTAAALTNNVTAGGTTDVVDTWTDLTTYATDANAIRNAVYQLTRKVVQHNTALRNLGAVA